MGPEFKTQYHRRRGGGGEGEGEEKDRVKCQLLQRPQPSLLPIQVLTQSSREPKLRA
jgi:hypothetical protein